MADGKSKAKTSTSGKRKDPPEASKKKSSKKKPSKENDDDNDDNDEVTIKKKPRILPSFLDVDKKKTKSKKQNGETTNKKTKAKDASGEKKDKTKDIDKKKDKKSKDDGTEKKKATSKKKKKVADSTDPIELSKAEAEKFFQQRREEAEKEKASEAKKKEKAKEWGSVAAATDSSSSSPSSSSSSSSSSSAKPSSFDLTTTTVTQVRKELKEAEEEMTEVQSRISELKAHIEAFKKHKQATAVKKEFDFKRTTRIVPPLLHRLMELPDCPDKRRNECVFNAIFPIRGELAQFLFLDELCRLASTCLHLKEMAVDTRLKMFNQVYWTIPLTCNCGHGTSNYAVWDEMKAKPESAEAIFHSKQQSIQEAYDKIKTNKKLLKEIKNTWGHHPHRETVNQWNMMRYEAVPFVPKFGSISDREMLFNDSHTCRVHSEFPHGAQYVDFTTRTYHKAARKCSTIVNPSTYIRQTPRAATEMEQFIRVLEFVRFYYQTARKSKKQTAEEYVSDRLSGFTKWLTTHTCIGRFPLFACGAKMYRREHHLASLTSGSNSVLVALQQ